MGIIHDGFFQENWLKKEIIISIEIEVTDISLDRSKNSSLILWAAVSFLGKLLEAEPEVSLRMELCLQILGKYQFGCFWGNVEVKIGVYYWGDVSKFASSPPATGLFWVSRLFRTVSFGEFQISFCFSGTCAVVLSFSICSSYLLYEIVYKYLSRHIIQQFDKFINNIFLPSNSVMLLETWTPLRYNLTCGLACKDRVFRPDWLIKLDR